MKAIRIQKILVKLFMLIYPNNFN